jgi:broad specificity phosphatase PhoE
LTETGKWQCEQQRVIASRLNPELVIVSPLARTIQTAKISFAHYYDDPSLSIPWIAHEACREETGVLTCNKRRKLSEIVADFPDLNFHEMTEEDTLWNPSERESNQSKSERIYHFLVNFIAKRPETSIAVISHSAWLFHMLNAVVDCEGDLELASWFLTGEIRSIKLTFSTKS